jgi:hypothetical protein
MEVSLKALLQGLIDYAGLFPPAALDMHTSVDNYASYRTGNQAWMLGRFICPASRLEEFEAAAAAHLTPDAPWPLSILARGGANRAAFLETLDEDARALRASFERLRGAANPDTVELKLPPLEGDPRAEVATLLAEAAEHLAFAGSPLDHAFLEIPLGADWEEFVPRAMEGIAAHNREEPPVPVGAKIRTGGVEASAFPSPAQVAGFLVAARDAGVAIKATAGLHHPLRHFAASVNTRMHGFLNLFGGAALLHAGAVDRAALTRLLEDQDPSHFEFDAIGFTWQGHHAANADLARTRHGAALSYGSCSFTEPLEDLEALGLMARRAE